MYRLETDVEYLYNEDDEDVDPALFSYQFSDISFVFSKYIYILLYKPQGYECSRKPAAYPSIYTLLPQNIRDRPATKYRNEVQAVGRLDWDTTGLILLSDDGNFLHKITSPKSNLNKCYRVSLKHEINNVQVNMLLNGVVLNDDPKPVFASSVELQSEVSCYLTINQGKYHQVKRMFASVGNRVEGLHRVSVGDLKLPDQMLPGQWIYLKEADLKLLNYQV